MGAVNDTLDLMGVGSTFAMLGVYWSRTMAAPQMMKMPLMAVGVPFTGLVLWKVNHWLSPAH